jgi:histidine triad (HIT) family protein
MTADMTTATTTDCIFCKIAAGTIPSKKVFENDDVYAFHDISPSAPTHVLVIPRQHISSVAAVTDQNAPLIGRIMATIAQIARDQGIESGGYRVVTNIGKDGGQSVEHLHFHILGGRPMTWPPG